CKPVHGGEVKDVPGLDPSTSYYEIVFSDNGIGFNQDYALQIFGLFKRLNDKNSFAGSGIGLSLCKKVVVNHGGVILANGKEGVGAQFYVYLPLHQNITTPPAAEKE
ncbi:MAG TPA: ATP-binding protein, partial [Flavisolibacter sp.]|nr:ATP-binding protein [Flavisolibacter sp.]